MANTFIDKYLPIFGSINVTHKTKVFISILISVILFLVLYFNLSSEDRNFLNVLGIVGFLLSVLGIVISYIQILSIKDITENTRIAVENNIKLNNNLLMISDLSRKAAMIDEIQSFIKDDKIELCILRMKDLKVILNAVKNQEAYVTIVSKREFRTVFEDFNIDLDNFQQHHLNNKNKLDKGKIISNLDSLSSLLLGLEVKIKNLSNDN